MFDQRVGASSDQADWIIKNQIQVLNPKSVVDFGAGGGKNCRFLRELLGPDIHITAVEAYRIAAELLLGNNLYNRIDNVLLEHWTHNNVNKYDLAIFGDVLEHLKPRIIRQVINKSLKFFKHIIIVVPLHEIFQGAEYGNELEIHRTYIGADYFDRYDPKEKHIVYGDYYNIMNILLSSEAKNKIQYHKKVLRIVRHYIIVFLQPFGLARAFVRFEAFIRR